MMKKVFEICNCGHPLNEHYYWRKNEKTKSPNRPCRHDDECCQYIPRSECEQEEPSALVSLLKGAMFGIITIFILGISIILGKLLSYVMVYNVLR